MNMQYCSLGEFVYGWKRQQFSQMWSSFDRFIVKRIYTCAHVW